MTTGKINLFLAKYNSTGALQWARNTTGTPGDCLGTDIAYNKSSGDVYVTGQYSGTVPMGTTTLTTSSTGVYHSFIAQYSQSGALSWVRTLGPNIFSKAIDASGTTVCVVGRFTETARFGSTTFTAQGTGTDIFVASYDYFGGLQWAKKAGGTDNDGYGKLDIAVNGPAIYIAGNVAPTTSATFGSITITSSSFLAKYDSDGLIQWVKTDQNNAYNISLDVDNDNNVYCAGKYPNYSPTSLIAKYGPDGTRKWIRTATVSGLSNWHHYWGFNGLIVNLYGDVFAVGNLGYSLETV